MNEMDSKDDSLMPSDRNPADSVGASGLPKRERRTNSDKRARRFMVCQSRKVVAENGRQNKNCPQSKPCAKNVL